MGTYRLGRVIDHVHIRVSDIAASRRFYAAALGALGLATSGEDEGWFEADELFVSDDGTPTRGLHVALQADSPRAVERFHAAVGNNVEAVFHGPTHRSAPHIVVEST